MKGFLQTSLILLLLWTPLQAQETIAWSATDSLVWTNFKSTPNEKMQAVALTASGLTFGYSVKQTNNLIVSFNAEVYAHFYPDKSWVKQDRETSYILGHEQLHFDITELHARMLRKELSELRITNNLKRRVQQIHNRINMDMDKMQNLYDRETNHSINVEAQRRWEKDVTEALKALEAYTSPYISVGTP